MGIQAEGILVSTDDFGVNMALGVGGMITAWLFRLSGYVFNHAQNVETLSMIRELCLDSSWTVCRHVFHLIDL
ncbi:hypothetical protein GCM10007968_13800 [Sporolactobacillus putidus]|uniref:Uncharacterized protein n=1 Tax=Sporolactobacillus putidus TaxID=492735 RepID=A0A917S2I9_9BACL|nr:hypothetical protein GCM10007968_13800 [Sporolactobacillus putidus]